MDVLRPVRFDKTSWVYWNMYLSQEKKTTIREII